MIVLGFALIFSILPMGNNAQAGTEKLDQVKFGSSISRDFDEYGMDYFYFKLEKNQSVNFNIKDAKKKELSVMLVSGLDIKLFQKVLKEEMDGIDSTVTEKELGTYLDNFKMELMFDNLKGEDSVGVSQAEIGLRKGEYVVMVMSDSNIKKYGKNYRLSIKNSTNKDVEMESNDSFKTATAIKRSHTYKASFFTIFDDEDYFKVNVHEAGQLVIKSTMKTNEKQKLTVYDAKKKKLVTTIKKTGKTYIAQAAVKKGSYYIRVSSASDLLNTAYADYTVKAYVKTKTPKSVVRNKKGNTNDTITLSGLQKGAKVTLYKDAKKKTVLTSRTASSSKMIIKTKALNDRGGKVYVTVKNKALYTSSMKKINYKASK